jgi:hypothetical protein
MPNIRFPETDEERIKILQGIIDREDLNNSGDDSIVSVKELYDLHNFLMMFEGAGFCVKQAREDEAKAEKKYAELFYNAHLYISHFIQVLFLAVIRKEVKAENLYLYGFNENDRMIPDLSTEETLLQWGERIIRGETERTSRGGIPIYTPAIAKVKVHHDLFKETLYSLSIYRKNTLRTEDTMIEKRVQADAYIADLWSRVEAKYGDLGSDERAKKYEDYHIHFHAQKGVQLNVFD